MLKGTIEPGNWAQKSTGLYGCSFEFADMYKAEN
jgi:hypothetical protein